MIEIKNLEFIYNSGFSLKVPTFKINKGEAVAITGPNGCGKSTFLNCLRGILQIKKGEINFGKTQLNNLNAKKRSAFRLKNIGSIFQDLSLIPYLTIEDNLNINSFLGSKRLNKNGLIIKKLKLETLLKKFPSELSGGEKQRVAFARAFLHEPSLIIADEPTNHLDKINKDLFLKTLLDYNQSSKTIICVTHDDYYLKNFKKIIEFNNIAL